VLTESGEAVARGQDPARLLAAANFPKELLHPVIREKSWRAIVNSSNAGAEDELADAVRSAFAVLEEAVRTAGGFTRNDSGAPLMRDAFNVDKGPIRDRDMSRPQPEREALGHLFAGAYSRFRHTVAHGTPRIELTDAQDQLLLASHLLRIVDAQRQ
jgi:sugar (pentulose or hexulose) kinase